MTETRDTAVALGKWLALLGGLLSRHCVTCNAMFTLLLSVEHRDEIAAATGRPMPRKGDNTGNVVVIDYGTIQIVKDLVGGELTIRELGETVFVINPERGPVEGGSVSWLATLAAIARQLEERFGRPGVEHLD